MSVPAPSPRRALPWGVLLLALVALAPPRPAAAGGDGAAGAGVAWQGWTDDVAARARAEGRVVLLTVSASWCHWCHVMQRETYADPRVVARVGARFLPVKVDADARPDLAERYAEYHWPATVFLGGDGREVLALRGYRGPDDFLRILDDVDRAARAGRTLLDAPPSRNAAVAGDLDLGALRARLRALLDATWDEAQAGWGFGQKYPYAPAAEVAWLRSHDADGAREGERARRAVAAWSALIDPVWGGMYQYSEGGTWATPHYEKIMAVQAGALRAHAAATRRTRDPRWAREARAVLAYLRAFLRAPSGAFGTSQDADLRRPDGTSVDGAAYFGRDDAGRRALGMPRIDRAVYAQENGWAVEAMVALATATGDAALLDEAVAAARAVLATHDDGAGGLRHAADDRGPLHLGDQAAFGRAAVALWGATGDGAWLARAERLAETLLARFLDRARGGFVATTGERGPFGDALRPFDGNVAAARFLLALAAAKDDARWRREALRAMAVAAAPGVPERHGWRSAALLLAVEEATRPVARATVVGDAGDARTEALLAAARAADAPGLVVERVDEDGTSVTGAPAPPASDGPALFLCGEGRCSSPVRAPADVEAAARAFLAGR
ncbi:MAG: thioredoxin domain-containing protein [Planctomycetia bacterium]|nr:thioredoxin domain-containing protein [Planctomycetia bacterium]